MRRVLCGILLLVLGMAPTVEARSKVQLSKRQLRRRYVVQPYNKKHKKLPKSQKAQWGAARARKH